MNSNIAIQGRFIALLAIVAAVIVATATFAFAESASAHAVTGSAQKQFTYYPPVSPPRQGCVKYNVNVGESYIAGNIALNSWGSVYGGDCVTGAIGGGTTTTILAKYNGTGPWGGFAFCKEWNTQLSGNTPGSWFQSASVKRPCGAGTYTVFICDGYRYSPTYIWAADAGSSTCYSGSYTSWFKGPNHTF